MAREKVSLSVPISGNVRFSEMKGTIIFPPKPPDQAICRVRNVEIAPAQSTIIAVQNHLATTLPKSQKAVPVTPAGLLKTTEITLPDIPRSGHTEASPPPISSCAPTPAPDGESLQPEKTDKPSGLNPSIFSKTQLKFAKPVHHFIITAQLKPSRLQVRPGELPENIKDVLPAFKNRLNPPVSLKPPSERIIERVNSNSTALHPSRSSQNAVASRAGDFSERPPVYTASRQSPTSSSSPDSEPWQPVKADKPSGLNPSILSKTQLKFAKPVHHFITNMPVEPSRLQARFGKFPGTVPRIKASQIRINPVISATRSSGGISERSKPPRYRGDQSSSRVVAFSSRPENPVHHPVEPRVTLPWADVRNEIKMPVPDSVPLYNGLTSGSADDGIRPPLQSPIEGSLSDGDDKFQQGMRSVSPGFSAAEVVVRARRFSFAESKDVFRTAKSGTGVVSRPEPEIETSVAQESLGKSKSRREANQRAVETRAPEKNDSTLRSDDKKRIGKEKPQPPGGHKLSELQQQRAVWRHLTPPSAPHRDSDSLPIRNLRELADKIRARAQLLKSAQQTVLEMRLAPAQLGTVHLQIKIVDDQMHLSFTADRPEAVAALQQSREELASLIAPFGFNLAHCDVEDGQSRGRGATGTSQHGSDRPSPDGDFEEEADTPGDHDHATRKMIDYGYNTMELVA